MRLLCPMRHVLWPVGDHRHDGQRFEPGNQRVQQLLAGRIDPMHVLEHHQHRRAPGKGFQLSDQRLEGLLLLLLRREIERRIALGGQREQGRNEWRRLGTLLWTARQPGFHLVQLLLGRILARKGRRDLELLGDGVQRGIEVIGRALVAQARCAARLRSARAAPGSNATCRCPAPRRSARPVLPRRGTVSSGAATAPPPPPALPAASVLPHRGPLRSGLGVCARRAPAMLAPAVRFP